MVTMDATWRDTISVPVMSSRPSPMARRPLITRGGSSNRFRKAHWMSRLSAKAKPHLTTAMKANRPVSALTRVTATLIATSTAIAKAILITTATLITTPTATVTRKWHQQQKWRRQKRKKKRRTGNSSSSTSPWPCHARSDSRPSSTTSMLQDAVHPTPFACRRSNTKPTNSDSTAPPMTSTHSPARSATASSTSTRSPSMPSASSTSTRSRMPSIHRNPNGTRTSMSRSPCIKDIST
mmetsp:Transcript_19214/g.53401  ORF Transcript_19214/g.53401 Transcript_19214/m.53401 type:complete len:238 (-) Transcript_19214:219-932(-)